MLNARRHRSGEKVESAHVADLAEAVLNARRHRSGEKLSWNAKADVFEDPCSTPEGIGAARSALPEACTVSISCSRVFKDLGTRGVAESRTRSSVRVYIDVA